MTDKPPNGVVNGVVKTTGKVIDALSNPVLIFLILLVVVTNGGMLWIWTQQRAEALEAVTNILNACLPGFEKE